jgi:uncharacterized transporter YbjL
MNRILADMMSFFNIIIAIGIIFIGAQFGITFITFGGKFVGLAIGIILGLLGAALICGTIASITLIERHLNKIANSGGNSVKPSAPPNVSNRIEPRL